MRKICLLVVHLLLSIICFAQSKNIQKAWIKTSIEKFSVQEPASDTMYLRYTFEKTLLNIGFYPGWDDYQQNWSISGNNLVIGFDTYLIEELSDTSMVIFLKGFQRIKFLSEEYLSSKEENLELLGNYMDKPYYKANNFISPRYISGKSINNLVSHNMEGYNIRKAITFRMQFIVDEKGKLGKFQILNGISSGYDEEVIKLFMKTSKKWKPALFRKQPIQTQVTFELKYLDSTNSPY